MPASTDRSYGLDNGEFLNYVNTVAAVRRRRLRRRGSAERSECGPDIPLSIEASINP